MYYKKILLITTCLFLLQMIVSCKDKKILQASNITPHVTAIVVKSAQYVNNTIVTGTVLAWNYVDIHPEWSGRVVYLNFPDGAYVTQGTLLAKIYDQDLQANLEKLRADSVLAALTEERYAKLLKAKALNLSDYDVAVDQLEQVKANIKITEVQIGFTEIRARFSGRLGLRQISLGQYITPQTIIGNIQTPDQVKIDFTTPEIYANLIKIGKIITILTADNETRKARIIAIQPDITTSTRNILTRAVLVDGKPSIRPGSFIKVLLDINQGKPIIAIPSICILQDADYSKVALIHNHVTSLTQIEIGNVTDNSTEITSGLQVGDTIVYDGMNFVRDKYPLIIDSIVNYNIGNDTNTN